MINVSDTYPISSTSRFVVETFGLIFYIYMSVEGLLIFSFYFPPSPLSLFRFCRMKRVLS